MQLAAQGASLSSHADLWQWLQGGVQKLLPHDVLLVCWGDFRSRNLRFDLVSSLPGLRTSECQASMVAPLASYLRDCWVAAQNLPCQVDVAGCADLLGDSGTGWPAGHPIAGMQSALVHGMQEAGDGTERIFAMLSRRPRYDAAAASMLRLLVPFVDLSLRCMPPVPARPVHGERASLSGEKLTLPVASLSERERQIMAWVAMGKTNPEIGCILRISEFTVKNHMKSIFSKLDVTNRAQAVAKLTRMATHA
ncbi:XrtB/PEP-CTERM-associated transcriptional regulator EpsA [Ramlibacter tataouinensis]|nr:XrtB/PEP-CTERM-associated transcriptional regulator EpsA [Ramlibacter tataouinensis]